MITADPEQEKHSQKPSERAPRTTNPKKQSRARDSSVNCMGGEASTQGGIRFARGVRHQNTEKIKINTPCRRAVLCMCRTNNNWLHAMVLVHAAAVTHAAARLTAKPLIIAIRATTHQNPKRSGIQYTPGRRERADTQTNPRAM